MYPKDTVTQLHPHTPVSLFDSFYNSQGYSGSILTGLHTGYVPGHWSFSLSLYAVHNPFVPPPPQSLIRWVPAAFIRGVQTTRNEVAEVEDLLIQSLVHERQDNLKVVPLARMNFTLILWHIDPLLGNDRETNETTVVTRQRLKRNNGGMLQAVFSVWSALRLYHSADRFQFS
jgi:hypothetical protein